ncbi:MAG TPA: response regulator [Gemmataceae bacterium]|nr:response regulator [Gemmataceae bacterium]
MSNERTLLVVEDNEVARERLAAILRRAGYEVALATNGQEALNYLDGHPPPALILLDMLMPVLDGWHFLEQLQGDIPEPTVPIVVTTGTILNREWAKSHGCAGFVKKPIDTDALLEEIRHCPEQADATNLTCTPSVPRTGTRSPQGGLTVRLAATREQASLPTPEPCAASPQERSSPRSGAASR